jgi:hypothetical protein
MKLRTSSRFRQAQAGPGEFSVTFPSPGVLDMILTPLGAGQQ